MRKFLIRNYFKSAFALLIGVLLFISSTLFIWGDLTFGRIAEIEEDEISAQDLVDYHDQIETSKKIDTKFVQ